MNANFLVNYFSKFTKQQNSLKILNNFPLWVDGWFRLKVADRGRFESSPQQQCSPYFIE